VAVDLTQDLGQHAHECCNEIKKGSTALELTLFLTEPEDPVRKT